MPNEDLVTLTADIVAAHVANNNVAVSDLALLIANVHGALAGLNGSAAPAEEKRAPVISARASVKPDFLVCMACGTRQKTLKRHLRVAHDLTPEQYRTEFSLPASYPMTAPNYSEQRRAMAKQVGLGRKPAQGGAKRTSRAARGGARKTG